MMHCRGDTGGLWGRIVQYGVTSLCLHVNNTSVRKPEALQREAPSDGLAVVRV